MELPKKPKSTTMTSWPVYMFVVSAIYLVLSLWSLVKLQESGGVWWRLVIALAFSFMFVVCMYISKYEKLHLVAVDDDESFLIEIRMLFLKKFSRFTLGQIVNAKLKESGKSTKCYTVEINLVDGRHFQIFASGVKEKTLRNQFMIRRFVEEYFENKLK
ncbi:hypothetical protein SteCoe_6789 [Stentor coeruleus]|uniref:Uncharacterized protein n=1 Tax=Stentor coeruleus TaxID=5963 RepID=A0A1R2CP77_9CILI|nr:hypothetical protein SteCoe_6789 [Stentor coeruleus]